MSFKIGNRVGGKGKEREEVKTASTKNRCENFWWQRDARDRYNLKIILVAKSLFYILQKEEMLTWMLYWERIGSSGEAGKGVDYDSGQSRQLIMQGLLRRQELYWRAL